MDNFRTTNMTATFQLWISTSSICLSVLHLLLSMINLAVRVNWYQLLSKHGINTEYNPHKFHAIVQRCQLKNSSITALIFKSGRVVLTGGTTPEECRKGALRVCRRVNHAVYKDLKETRLRAFAVYHFKIQNMACAFKCKHQLALEKMYDDYIKNSHHFNISGWKAKMTYRPTSFTAVRLNYQLQNKKIALMIFINGNVTLSGFKKEEDSLLFAHEFYDKILVKYIRTS